eukprot:c20806_g1_i4.p1 GENE.c20806_g1_i4~~c20806_g1_i4.p1  ORF type:complete len:318 (-),score=84.74 c20806_g1_i4:921-1874(-)
MFDELFEAMSRYKQSILETIDSCVGVATTQHQGLVNLIDKSNQIVREIQNAQSNGDGLGARDRLDVKQRANKLHKVLENVKLTQAVRAGQNSSPLIQFTLDLGEMLKALTHHSSLSLADISVLSSPSLSLPDGTSVIFDKILQANMGQVFEVAQSRVPSLRLLYRWSRDGRTAKAFHEKCDKAGPTLVVIRDSQGHVFGGYSTKSWEGPTNPVYIPQAANEVFLFSLKGPQNGDKPAMFRPNQNPCSNATYNDAKYGLSFNDLWLMYKNNNTNHWSRPGNIYQSVTHASLVTVTANNDTLAGSAEFTISEMEVFSCS